MSIISVQFEQITCTWNQELALEADYLRPGIGPVFELRGVENWLLMVSHVLRTTVMDKQYFFRPGEFHKFKYGKRDLLIAIGQEFIKIGMQVRIPLCRQLRCNQLCAGDMFTKGLAVF